MAYAVEIDPAYVFEGLNGPTLDASVADWVAANAPSTRASKTVEGIKLHFAERKLAESFILGFI